MATSLRRAIVAVQSLGFPFPTPDPFLFAVHHRDYFPQGNPHNMEAPRRGNGADFNPDAPYRMYHGKCDISFSCILIHRFYNILVRYARDT